MAKKAAKKKTSKKSKKGVKKKASKKQETVFDRMGKKEKTKPTVAMLAAMGIRRCWLCGTDCNGIADFEKHLGEQHSKTVKEHDGLFPAQATPYTPYGQGASPNQLYRAMLHRMVNGQWPEWFDGNKKVDLSKADPELLRIAANMLLTYQMQRIAPCMEFSQVAMRRLFQAADAATMEYADVQAMADLASMNIQDALKAITKIAEVLDHANSPSGEQPSISGAFVAAGVIEAHDSREQAAKRIAEQKAHHSVAAVAELSAAVHGMLTQGPENGPDVPSKVNPPKMVEAEVVDAEAGRRQASDNAEEESAPTSPDGTHQQ